MNFLRYFIFLLLSIWAIGESLTRFFVPIDPEKHALDILTDHPYIRCDWAPNFKATYVVEGIGGQKGTIPFEINPFGFRSSSMKTARKMPGTYRIFFLGGSTTESVVIPENKTFPYLVERKLAESFPGKHFECINGGISSAIAPDTLATLIYKVMYYEPDAVIYMQAINDLRYGTLPVYDPVIRNGYRRETNASGFFEETRSLVNKVLKKSYFLTLFKWKIINRFFPPAAEKFKSKLDEYNDLRQQRRLHPFMPISESKSLDDYRKHVQEIIFIARAHKVRLILMTEPFIYQKNLPPEIDDKLWMGYFPKYGINLSNELLTREMNRFNDALRELAQKYSVELIDLEKETPKNLNYLYDDVHLTPQGSQHAAEVIGDFLMKHSP